MEGWSSVVEIQEALKRRMNTQQGKEIGKLILVYLFIIGIFLFASYILFNQNRLRGDLVTI